MPILQDIEDWNNDMITLDELYDRIRWCYKQVEDEIVDQGRWQTTHRYVVQDGNKYYSFENIEGSTECCDGEEFDPETIQEVVPQEVTVIKYIPKENK